MLVWHRELNPSQCERTTEALQVSTDAIYLAENSSQSITVSWNVTEAVNIMDWIGLYVSDEDDNWSYVDHRSYSVITRQTGAVQWNITRASVGYNTNYIHFRYVNGITGAVVARSDNISLCQRAELFIKDVHVHTEHLNCASTPSKEVVFRVDCKSFTISGDKATDQNRFSCSSTSKLSVTVGNFSQSISLSELQQNEREFCQSLHRSDLPTVLITYEITPIVETMNNRNAKSERSSMTSSSSTGSEMSQQSTSGSSQHSGMSTDSGLPAGWEIREDEKGRRFYIDHNSKKTMWKRPEISDNSDSEDCRSTFARRTIGAQLNSTTDSASQFLARSDFISLLHENSKALHLYNSSAVLKHIVHRIRRCDESVQKYESHSEFVNFVNCFADSTQPLPNGWQAGGRNPIIYIDHMNRRTTLIDPRLPCASTETNRKRGRSAPPTRRSLMDKNGNMLEMLSRMDELLEVVERRMPELVPSVRRKLKLIEKVGVTALIRLANDEDLARALSIMELEESPLVSELEERLAHFYSCLNRAGYGRGTNKIRLRFSRANLLRDAFDQIMFLDADSLRKAKLTIIFDDEDGLDYGGPSRELFFLLSRELFNPSHGLFEYSSDDGSQYTVQISTLSSFIDNELTWFELAGRILGLALLHRCLVDTFFTNIFYKIILEKPIELSDMEALDVQFYNSLLWIRENNVDPSLGLTFTTNLNTPDGVMEQDLLPNGSELFVTNENKEEFISLMVKWRAFRGVSSQTSALLRGLHQIVDRDYLRVFSPDQLQLVLSGSLEINLDDWRNNTDYKGGYYDEHVVIEWFWDLVQQMTNAQRLQLLQFVTGAASVPFEGFSMLRGSTGPKRFTIEKWGEENSLPRAHTCFNRLDLPCYPTKQILKAKLLLAMTEGINYAIE